MSDESPLMEQLVKLEVKFDKFFLACNQRLKKNEDILERLIKKARLSKSKKGSKIPRSYESWLEVRKLLMEGCNLKDAALKLDMPYFNVWWYSRLPPEKAKELRSRLDLKEDGKKAPRFKALAGCDLDAGKDESGSAKLDKLLAMSESLGEDEGEDGPALVGED